jgi:hypothetical protein
VSPGRAFAVGLLYALGGYAVAIVVLPTERSAPLRILVVALFVGALASARRLVPPAARPSHPRPAGAGAVGPPEEPVVRVARTEAALAYATESRGHFDRAVRPMLVRLAEERLRARHGVVLADRPAAARAVMGEELWQLIEEERAGRRGDGPGPRPEELAELVARLETI